MGMATDEDINDARLNVTWLSDLDGVLNTTSPDSEGFVTFVWNQPTVGHHVITLLVEDDVGGLCSATIPISIGTPPNLEIIIHRTEMFFLFSKTFSFETF